MRLELLQAVDATVCMDLRSKQVNVVNSGKFHGEGGPIPSEVVTFRF